MNTNTTFLICLRKSLYYIKKICMVLLIILTITFLRRYYYILYLRHCEWTDYNSNLMHKVCKVMYLFHDANLFVVFLLTISCFFLISTLRREITYWIPFMVLCLFEHNIYYKINIYFNVYAFDKTLYLIYDTSILMVFVYFNDLIISNINKLFASKLSKKKEVT